MAAAEAAPGLQPGLWQVLQPGFLTAARSAWHTAWSMSAALRCCGAAVLLPSTVNGCNVIVTAAMRWLLLAGRSTTVHWTAWKRLRSAIPVRSRLVQVRRHVLAVLLC